VGTCVASAGKEVDPLTKSLIVAKTARLNAGITVIGRVTTTNA